MTGSHKVRGSIPSSPPINILNKEASKVGASFAVFRHDFIFFIQYSFFQLTAGLSNSLLRFHFSM